MYGYIDGMEWNEFSIVIVYVLKKKESSIEWNIYLFEISVFCQQVSSLFFVLFLLLKAVQTYIDD